VSGDLVANIAELAGLFPESQTPDSDHCAWTPFSEDKVSRLLNKTLSRLATSGLALGGGDEAARSDDMTSKPLLIQFTNLLHACRSCDAPAVKEFLAKHKDDETFQRRARAVMDSWQVKQQFEKRYTEELAASRASAASGGVPREARGG